MKLKTDNMKIYSLSKNNYNIISWKEKFPNYQANLFQLKINSSWRGFTQSDIFKEEIKNINKYLSACLEKSNGNINIFPYPDLLFCSLNSVSIDKIKVVILGQDPYFNSYKIGDKIVPQAMGLSFSVPKNITIPPSLNNIYENLLKYGHVREKPTHGNLMFWAFQGCLLLNTTLTVQEKMPNCHEKIWKKLTDALIKFVSEHTHNVVFMLWGNPALKKLDLIDTIRHKIIISSHPSPMSFMNKLRNYNSFMDTDHFGEANKYLQENGKEKIIYDIV